MEFIKRINYLGNFTLLFVLTGLSFALMIIFILYFELTSFQHKLDIEKAEIELKYKVEKTHDFYNHFEKFLTTIEHNRFFTSYIKSPSKESKEDLITLFKTLTEHEKYVTQLRYINSLGDEVVRIDRNRVQMGITLIDETKLQNKSHRDYFIETMQKNRGDIFVSNLDLNIEHKKIEVPHKPVWRFATPVMFDGKKEGIIIVNVFAKYLLNDILKSELFIIDIFDQDGEILVSNDSTKNEWTRYLNTPSKLDRDSFILSSTLIDGINEETLFISATPKDWIGGFWQVLNYKILFLILFTIVIAFILAYFLAKIPKKLFDELEDQQKMLIHQSKLAAMGEMTNMLAHQWRQPLNAVGVLLQEIKIKKSMDILSDEEFNSLSNSINDKLKYMSETINNFRDFFKPKKRKELFNIKESIQSAYELLQVKLESRDIFYSVDIVESGENSCELHSFEGEFKQVVVNIINNAIEALEERCDENRYIKAQIHCLDESIEIEIEDSAGGIEEQNLEKIFEPYFSTKEEKNGSGIGLYMSKMIVEKNMGGNLIVYNKDLGACFKIVLYKEQL